MAEEQKKTYSAEDIKVLEGLEGVRKMFDSSEFSSCIKKRGDTLILSKELKIKQRSLYAFFEEKRILSIFPNLQKSKANVLSRLKTNRELGFFSKSYDVYSISVRKLYELVKIWNNDVQLNPLKILSGEEHELILGTILGDASVKQRDKNNCLRISHSLKQKDYLIEIKNKLQDFEVSEFSERTRNINNRELKVIDFSTKTHPIFNYYRNLFYKNGVKVINSDILSQLTARSLSYWICDDGSFCNKQKYFILCTNSYTFEEHKLIKEFFNNKFGLNPVIGFRDNKYYYLRFNKQDSQKLINIIKPYIPESMVYKIGGIKNVA